MKLNEFVKNLKYKSIQLEIYGCNGCFIWCGTVSMFEYWVNVNKYDFEIDIIQPRTKNTFAVYLKEL